MVRNSSGRLCSFNARTVPESCGKSDFRRTNGLSLLRVTRTWGRNWGTLVWKRSTLEYPSHTYIARLLFQLVISQILVLVIIDRLRAIRLFVCLQKAGVLELTADLFPLRVKSSLLLHTLPEAFALRQLFTFPVNRAKHTWLKRAHKRRSNQKFNLKAQHSVCTFWRSEVYIGTKHFLGAREMCVRGSNREQTLKIRKYTCGSHRVNIRSVIQKVCFSHTNNYSRPWLPLTAAATTWLSRCVTQRGQRVPRGSSNK